MHSLKGLSLLVLLLVMGCNAGLEDKAKVEQPTQPNASPSAPKVRGEGLALLSKVMQKYKSAKTFEATGTVELIPNSSEKDKSTIWRLYLVESPSKFRVVSSLGTLKNSSISDGKLLVEFDSTKGEQFDAPSTIAEANSPCMSNFSLSGSLLYRFFGGSEYVDDLVQAGQGQVKLTAGPKPGQSVVSFHAIDPYGDTEVLIDEKSLTVLSIKSKMDRIVADSQQIEEKYRLKSLMMTESFKNVKFDEPFAPDTFVAKAPAGIKLADRRYSADGRVRAGTMAPDFAVKSLAGREVKLSSLRDRVVMLDFWATWCGPCRESLPDTVALANQYRGKGLEVLAITSDEPEAIDVFMGNSGLKDLPAYVDQNSRTMEQYGIQFLPSVIIIDRAGRVSAMMEGMQEKREIIKALRKAGLEIETES